MIAGGGASPTVGPDDLDHHHNGQHEHRVLGLAHVNFELFAERAQLLDDGRLITSLVTTYCRLEKLPRASSRPAGESISNRCPNTPRGRTVVGSPLARIS